jgi:hypothetical protein
MKRAKAHLTHSVHVHPKSLNAALLRHGAAASPDRGDGPLREPIEAHPPWFRPETFLRAGFDPVAYVSELRSYLPLESLAAALRAHLVALRDELVGLINRDYADYVGLSVRHKGVDAADARMRATLANLRDKVAVFRGAAAAALRAGLQHRTAASAARELLELLLDASHVVSKVRYKSAPPFLLKRQCS